MDGNLKKQRRAEFRRIKRGLREFRRWAGDDFPTPEEFKAFERCYVGGDCSQDTLLLFQILSHPSPTLKDATAMASRVTVKNCTRSGLILNKIVRTPESPKDDILGGALSALVDFFYPKVFVERECADGRYVERFMRDLHPGRCIGGLATWLTITSSPNAQLLWPHRLDLVWQFDRIDRNAKLQSLRKLMNSVSRFVPPCGLPGDVLPHDDVVKQLREGFEARRGELPAPLAEAWDQAQTRAGRASWWEPHLFPEAELRTSSGDNGYSPYVVYDHGIEASHFALTISVLEELGVLECAEPVRAVDVGPRLHEKLLAALGYSPGEPVPGHMVRLRMNSEFVDSNAARVDLDIVRPWPHQERRAARDVPTMLWVTRPRKPWASIPSVKLYRALARRTFEDRAGIPLYIHSTLGDGSLKRAEDIDGSVRKLDYVPLASTKIPLLEDTSFDFPDWAGDPLPSFAIE